MWLNPLLTRLLLSLAAVLVVVSCAVNPATGRRELSLIGEGQEIRMGRDADPDIVASMGLYDDPALQEYVNDLGQRLAAVSERPNLPWTFRVLDDPTVNAFALPGGFIYVTRGILSHLNSEAELVGVLGHEIGHVTAKHSVSQMSTATVTQLGVVAGMILVPELQDYGGAIGAGMQLMNLKFGRDDENQADELGIRYMTRVDYDPRELADVMGMLGRSSEVRQGSGRVPQWLSTHPDPVNRVENIQAQVSMMSADLDSFEVGRDRFLDRIDGMVFGEDPREGYFEGDTFYHPELRFRLVFPSGWQHVNLKQAVQSVAPDQDAVFVLTLETVDPASAMSAFRAQEGVRLGQATERSVNGLNGIYAGFTATSQDGELRGVVGFVGHGGNTYRLLGFAPNSRWSRHSAVLEDAVLGFAPETRRQFLDVSPARLELVDVASGTSIEDFRARYPSSVPSEVIDLINHVRPGETLPPGRAKRVVGGR